MAHRPFTPCSGRGAGRKRVWREFDRRAGEVSFETVSMPTMQTSIPASRVPPSVARVAAGFRPSPADLAGADAITTALRGRAPFLIVNRDAAEAVHLLETGDRLRTAHDLSHRTAEQDRYVAGRASVERALDVYGDGVDAGTTVYGSLQFDPARTDWRGRTGPNTGYPDRFGSVAFQLTPAAAARATYSIGDSFDAEPGQLAGSSQLPQLLARTLDMRPLGAQLKGPVSAPADVRTRLRDVTRDGYVEAQVHGGVRLDDIASITVETAPERMPRREADDPGRPQLLAQLRQLAASRHIPLRILDAS